MSPKAIPLPQLVFGEKTWTRPKERHFVFHFGTLRGSMPGGIYALVEGFADERPPCGGIYARGT